MGRLFRNDGNYDGRTKAGKLRNRFYNIANCCNGGIIIHRK